MPREMPRGMGDDYLWYHFSSLPKSWNTRPTLFLDQCLEILSCLLHGLFRNYAEIVVTEDILFARLPYQTGAQMRLGYILPGAFYASRLRINGLSFLGKEPVNENFRRIGVGPFVHH